jgi:hypothetical protein
MRFETAVGIFTESAELSGVIVALQILLLPAKGQVRGRNNLDKVHVVEVGVVGLLLGAVKRITVVVRPGQRFGAELLGDVIRELRAESQRMNDVRKGVAAIDGGVPVVLEVVHVHVTVAEGASRRQVKVSDHLVHTQAALDAAALVSLLVEALGVVLALTLLDVLAAAKSPRGLSVRFPNFVTRVAAPGLLRVRRRLRAVAATAVLGVEMGCLIFGVVSEVARCQLLQARHASG